MMPAPAQQQAPATGPLRPKAVRQSQSCSVKGLVQVPWLGLLEDQFLRLLFPRLNQMVLRISYLWSN